MTQPVRTGVIGVGNMGQHHARIYASSPGSVLVGVADTNQERAREIASRYDVEAFTDYRDLLARVEAVSIAAPTTLHHRIGLDCLATGIHLLMEKPLAASAAEATELALAAHSSDLVLQVGHVERFNPTFVELANVLVVLDPKAALPVAEQAMAAGPGSAAITDTLGWVLFKNGQRDRALQLLRDARLRQPGNPTIRYHLAAVLADGGRHEEARTELQAALAAAPRFEGDAAARELLKSLP